MLLRYLLYLIRWQCSTPILAPVVAYFKHSPSLFGTTEDWIGSAVANIIGGLIFFWVDRFIFSFNIKNPMWEVKENINCVDCKGDFERGYRLVQDQDYDKTQDKNPEYRCEKCSHIKFKKRKE